MMALLLLCLMVIPAAAHADFAQQRSINVRLGASIPISMQQDFTTLVVSEPKIALAAAASTQDYYVQGRSIGTTNLLAYDAEGKLIQILDINVIPDIDAVRNDINQLYPGTDIRLHPVADKLHVSGTVISPERIERVLEIVKGHVGDNFIDALDTALPAQVLLEVRFVEASRDDIKEVGFGSEISRTGDFLLLTSSSPLSGPIGKSVGTLMGGSGATSIDLFIEALEEKGVVRTLAEPNLVTRSNHTASFLAGGEFPVPVTADEGSIRIEFKNFGVSLDFTPTVYSEDQIVLEVSPEVSGLDPRNSVRLSDVEIPALSVRRIDTQVELASGQSFAIAGLIQNDFQASKVQTPLLGDVPILGALFRSSRFKNNETELVVIITPHLIEPTRKGAHFDVPMGDADPVNAAELALQGRTENTSQLEFGDAVKRNLETQIQSSQTLSLEQD